MSIFANLMDTAKIVIGLGCRDIKVRVDGVVCGFKDANHLIYKENNHAADQGTVGPHREQSQKD